MRLVVPYRGSRTISELTKQYREYHEAVIDRNFPSRNEKDLEIDVDFLRLSSLPVLGKIDTDIVLAALAEKKWRGLNGAETLALGLKLPEHSHIGFGQVYRAQFMAHMLVVVRGSVRLIGHKALWCKDVVVPGTPV